MSRVQIRCATRFHNVMQVYPTHRNGYGRAEGSDERRVEKKRSYSGLGYFTGTHA
jgi:hypothetical protein